MRNGVSEWSWSVDADCRVNAVKMSGVITAPDILAAQHQLAAHASFNPPMGGMTQSDTVIDGRHVGACKPGQQPGDMTMPNGQTMNIRNMMTGNLMGGKK